MGIKSFRNYGILERLVALGYLELIEDVTISVATTSVTFSGFTVTKEDSLVLVSDFNNVGVSASNLSLYVNNDQVDANYTEQIMLAGNTAINAARVNTTRITDAVASTKAFSTTEIKLTNDGYFTFQSSTNREYDTSSIVLREDVVSKNATIVSITQLDIVASIASSIGIGSRFQLYRKIA